MMYADDAGIGSISTEGLANMMTVIVLGLFCTRSKRIQYENEDHAVADSQPGTPGLAGRHESGGTEESAVADIMIEIPRRVRLAWACYDHS